MEQLQKLLTLLLLPEITTFKFQAMVVLTVLILWLIEKLLLPPQPQLQHPHPHLQEAAVLLILLQDVIILHVKIVFVI
jgi:hypothetical protein